MTSIEIVRGILSVALYNLKNIFCKIGTWIVFLMVLWTLASRAKILADLAKKCECNVNFFGIFPTIYTNTLGICMMTILFGMLFFFGNLPEINSAGQFLMIRVGKYCWAAGQQLLAIFLAIIYTILLQVAVILPCLPVLGASKEEWGTVFYRLAVSDSVFLYGCRDLIQKYSPIEAWFHLTMLFFLLCCMIGSLSFVCSLFISRKAGLAISSSIICGSFLIAYIEWGNYVQAAEFLRRLSPVSMTQIEELGQKGCPSLTYAYLFLSVVSIILQIIAILFLRSHAILLDKKE